MYVLRILKDTWDSNTEDENLLLIHEFLDKHRKITSIFVTEDYVNIIAEWK